MQLPSNMSTISHVPIRIIHPDGQSADISVPYRSLVMVKAILDTPQPDPKDHTVIVGDPMEPYRIGSINKTPAALLRDIAGQAGWR